MCDPPVVVVLVVVIVIENPGEETDYELRAEIERRSHQAIRESRKVCDTASPIDTLSRTAG